MTIGEADARALVLHQFLALRRSGLSALDALNRLVEGLPDGALRSACRDAALSFSSSAPTTASDDLVRVLSDRSDDLSRAAMLADSFQASAELSAARRSGMLLMQMLLVGPIVGFTLIGFYVGNTTALWGGAALPAPTQLLLDFVAVLKLAGVPIAVVLALLISRWKRVPVFGAASLEASQGLFAASSHAEPMQAVSALKLDRVDRTLLVSLLQRGSPETASAVVTELARRLEREGRRRIEVHHVLSSLTLAFFGAFTAAIVLVVLYLPIFSIAGDIK